MRQLPAARNESGAIDSHSVTAHRIAAEATLFGGVNVPGRFARPHTGVEGFGRIEATPFISHARIGGADFPTSLCWCAVATGSIRRMDFHATRVGAMAQVFVRRLPDVVHVGFCHLERLGPRERIGTER